VRRVIFLSTPHRGSYLSSYRVSNLLARLVKMPLRLSQLTLDLASQGDDALVMRRLERPPTSLENMRPGHPFLLALAELPIAPQVSVHSIIAVRGDGPPEQGSDGVVRYASAHLDGAASELVVRSGHSVQNTPEAIQEVRQILVEHASAASAGAAAPRTPPRTSGPEAPGRAEDRAVEDQVGLLRAAPPLDAQGAVPGP